MDADSRHERTVRLLEARLEALAAVSERSPRAELRFDQQIVATLAATRHAIALELITSEEADAIWHEVAERHPLAAWCQSGPELAA
jgi:transcription elongation GreA/GreB family factor